MLAASCAAVRAGEERAAHTDDAVSRADGEERGSEGPSSPPATRKPAGDADQRCIPSTTATPALPEDWQRRHRVSRIVGKPLCSRAGSKLGILQDVVIDRQGRVAYGVIAPERAAEAQGKLFLVPWRELKPHPARDLFVLDISPERLLQAPAFDADDWPDVTDKRWAREVNRFYAEGNGTRTLRRDGGAPRPVEPPRQPGPAQIEPMEHGQAEHGMPQRARISKASFQPT